MKNTEIYDRIYLKHLERSLVIEYVDDLTGRNHDSDHWRLIDLRTNEVLAKSKLPHDVIHAASNLQSKASENNVCAEEMSKPRKNVLNKNRYRFLLGKECWKAFSSNTIYTGHVTSLREVNGWLEASVRWMFKGSVNVSNRKGHNSWERVASLSFERPVFETLDDSDFLDCQGLEE